MKSLKKKKSIGMPAMNTYFLCGSSIAEGKYGSCTCTDSHENWDDQLIRKTKKLRRLQKPGILGGGKESGIPGLEVERAAKQEGDSFYETWKLRRPGEETTDAYKTPTTTLLY